MNELAYDANGEPITNIPATATRWRARKLNQRGAPSLVYKDGRPATLPIDGTMEDLRELVDTDGKVRLDAIDDDGKSVDSVPPAYVYVSRPERGESAFAPVAAPSDDTLREAMRMNTELARAVIEKFPQVMTATAEILRAADGAGLSRREPRDERDDDEDDDDTSAPAASSSGFDFLNAIVAQIVPMVLSSIAGGNGLPKLDAVLDWRKATPTARKDAPAAMLDVASEADTSPDASATELPPIGPDTMAHFLAIQAALKPNEAKLARQLAAELTAAEMRAWLAELSGMSVPDAVAKIRSLVAGKATTERAS